MFQLTIPQPITVLNNPLSFRKYLNDVIAPLPFWRSREGAAFFEELCELIDGDSDTPTITDLFHEALAKQMALGDQGLGQLNPILSRVSIRYARVLYEAKKVEPKPKTADAPKLAEAPAEA